jgi:hypothetical protein
VIGFDEGAAADEPQNGKMPGYIGIGYKSGYYTALVAKGYQMYGDTMIDILARVLGG